MHAPKHWLGMIVLLVLASVLAGCITINPGALASPSPTPVSAAVFTSDLIAALAIRDYAKIEAAMGSPFLLAVWPGAAQALMPAEAAARLQTELIGPATSLTFVAPEVVAEWLGGADPLTIWPPEIKPVATIGLGGLGATGQGQAVLIVAEYPDGAFYWAALLLAPEGFANAQGEPPAVIIVNPPPPDNTIVLPTATNRLLILAATGIFAGPGSQYALLGTANRGEYFTVTGISPDGQWYAVTCAQSASACWITTNPIYVRPLTVAEPRPTSTAVPAQPTPTSIPTSMPERQPIRIQLPPGGDSAVVSGFVGPYQGQQYLLYGYAGQTLRLLLSSDTATANFSVGGVADGRLYKSLNDMAREWSLVLPRTQDYLITVVSPTRHPLCPRGHPDQSRAHRRRRRPGYRPPRRVFRHKARSASPLRREQIGPCAVGR